jgi:hypothetical protein
LNTFHQRIESRLWNLQSGDDWRDMCSTTPANFRGLHLDSPEICENWVRVYFFSSHPRYIPPTPAAILPQLAMGQSLNLT